MSRRHRTIVFIFVLDGGFVANAVDIQSGSLIHMCVLRNNFRLLIRADVKRLPVYCVAKM